MIEPAGISDIGFPAPNERMADMVLLAEDRYAFAWRRHRGSSFECPRRLHSGRSRVHQHGHAMNAAFVASGAGIKRGVKLGSIRNLDVAPTIAQLLGLEMKNIDGQSPDGDLALSRMLH